MPASGEQEPLIPTVVKTTPSRKNARRNDDHSTATPRSNRTNNNNNMARCCGPMDCGRIFCVSLVVLVLALFLICMLEFAFVVPPGSVGIVVTVGQVQSVESGIHYRIPFFSHVEHLSTKTQLLEEKNVVPTKEGLAVTLDTAVLYRLDPTKATVLYKTVGADYARVLLEPEASSAVRGLTSDYETKALYSSGRTMIQDYLKTELTTKLGPRGIIIEDVLLKDILLPEQLSQSIEAKVQAEQDAARMEFVLQKERQEAERKKIEAKGISDFQQIVSQGISPELLKWKGIETTQMFAESTNTKLVIMGNDGNGLPVILSADGDGASGTTTTSSGSSSSTDGS
mmetsp:Transcript_25593/g.70648  ORF Transcript_25593/g.70648 Transcript_25593/m.70648 type:complete len:341 (-) Transcript_25593:99-1121(-)